MAKNFIQEGENMTVPAPYDVVSGAGAKVGVLFGVAAFTALSGVDVVISTEGVWSLAKVSAQAWTVGAALYWDDSAKLVTTATTTGNLHIGCAAAAAANPSATGLVRLNGHTPTAVT